MNVLHRRHALRLNGGGLAILSLLLAAGCNGGREERTDGADGVRGMEHAEPAGPNAQPGQAAPATAGTFRAEVEEGETADAASRLPADGDLAVFVPATELFPGSGRLDPAIENPLSGDPAAIAAGERHFEAFNCAGCHAPLGGGGMGPPLSDDVWIHGGEPAQIYLSIMHGRPEGMPAWGSMLPRRTAWEMVAYIESLADIDDYAAEKGFERKPPPGASAPAGDQGGADQSTTGQ